jgi:hypothetical protein
MMGTFTTPTTANSAAARSPRLGSSNADRSDITPTYRNRSISSEVSLGSHAQYVPHIGRPQSEPVTNASNVKDAPIGAEAAATAWPILMRQMSATAPAPAMVV